MNHDFLENLPDKCPPGDAFISQRQIKAFRLVKHNPPQAKDFWSAKKQQPDRKFKDDCIAMGISVWIDVEKCRSVLLLPAHRDEKLCCVTIEKDSGFVLIDNESRHINWWPFAKHNVLKGCEVVDENDI